MTTSSAPAVDALPSTHRRICHLCHRARSVAEIAALLDLSLGVVRVIVADLAENGSVTISQPAPAAPDAELLQRVLSQLRTMK